MGSPTTRLQPNFDLPEPSFRMLQAIPGGGFREMRPAPDYPDLASQEPTTGLENRLATAATLFRLLESHLRAELEMLQALEARENEAQLGAPAGTKFVQALLAAERTYGEAFGVTGDSSECTVCLDPFKPTDLVVGLPCRHLYHQTCVLPWLQQHNTCPDCRGTVIDQAAETRAELALLNVHELRLQLTEAGIDHSRCIEKSDLVEMLQAHLEQQRNRTAAESIPPI